jgi:hypothetical protein
MNLPPCHSRRPIPLPGVAFCAHPKMHAPDNLATPEICAVCSYWREPPPADFRPVVMTKPRGPCKSLGPQTGLRECASCGGRVRVKVYACSHPRHGETTLAECIRCEDHAPRSEDEAAAL